MAVPTAVRRKREQQEAEYAALMANAPSADEVLQSVPDTPVQSVPDVAVPQVAPVAASQSQADSRDSRIAELEQLLRTRDGQASQSMRELNESKQRLDLMASQIAALEEANTNLMQQKETAEALATAKRTSLPSLDEVHEVTPDELEKFGADSVNFVSKLSKRELQALIKPLFEKVSSMETALARVSDLDKLPQLETSIKNVQAESQRVKDEEFFRVEVLGRFPDFVNVRTTPEWKEYLATDVPDKGYKIGHMLNHYRLLHDGSNIRSIIQGFYDRKEARPTLASLTVPSKTQTEGTVVTKPKLKASTYRDKLRAFTQRKLPKVEWETFKTEFNTAMNEGRVEMDAQL